MNPLKIHGLVHEYVYEKLLKLVLIPWDFSCKFHGYLSSSDSKDNNYTTVLVLHVYACITVVLCSSLNNQYIDSNIIDNKGYITNHRLHVHFHI